jgi:hypothetical protein
MNLPEALVENCSTCNGRGYSGLGGRCITCNGRGRQVRDAYARESGLDRLSSEELEIERLQKDVRRLKALLGEIP